jgi:LAO/AO transport system kinase
LVLAERLIGGDRRALSKAITLVESASPEDSECAARLLRIIGPRTGQSIRLGVSGAPGVGKSTFIDALGVHLLGLKHRLAVLAVDPSSSVSGGSVLGDKTRMPRLAVAADAFIRPSPSGGFKGGVAPRTRESLLVCEAAGYDVVMVETVGTGQSEHAVSEMVDSFVLLVTAGSGDELQGFKRGVMELVDVLVVNKSDGDGVERAENCARAYASGLSILRPPDSWGWFPPVLNASALESRGMDQVWQKVLLHRSWLASNGALSRKRQEQLRSALRSLLDAELTLRFLASPRVKAAYSEMERAVEQGELSPSDAVRRLLAIYEGER